MANIVIKDLTESVDLDRNAMRAITGGARSRRPAPGSSILQSTRIVSYPAGFARNPATGRNSPVK